jgi:hypothetical protein
MSRNIYGETGIRNSTLQTEDAAAPLQEGGGRTTPIPRNWSNRKKPRHYPCQQRLISLVGANVLGRFSMAGFEVITEQM